MRLRDDAIVTSDSGTIATWFAGSIPARRGQMFSLSGTLATMANGCPTTIAASSPIPRGSAWHSWATEGFSMLMAEFATAVKYKLPIKVVVNLEPPPSVDQMGADGPSWATPSTARPASHRFREDSPKRAAAGVSAAKTRR
jgi:hypothetical protein